LAVDGRYVVMGNTFEQLLANAEALVAKARASRAAAHKSSRVVPVRLRHAGQLAQLCGDRCQP
jgi:hypothetical protein